VNQKKIKLRNMLCKNHETNTDDTEGIMEMVIPNVITNVLNSLECVREHKQNVTYICFKLIVRLK